MEFDILPVTRFAMNCSILWCEKTNRAAVIVLRRTDAKRHRPFRTPAVNIVAPLAVLGSIYLFFSLSWYTLELFAAWAVVGLVVYFLYSRGHSHVGRGLVEVHEGDAGIPPQPIASLPGGVELD